MKIKLFVLVLCHPCHHIPFLKMFTCFNNIFIYLRSTQCCVDIETVLLFIFFLWLSAVSVSIQHCVSMIYIYLFSVLNFIGFFNDFNLWWWNTLTYLDLFRRGVLLALAHTHTHLKCFRGVINHIRKDNKTIKFGQIYVITLIIFIVLLRCAIYHTCD